MGGGEGLILRHGNTNDEMKPEKTNETNEFQKIKEQRVGQSELKDENAENNKLTKIRQCLRGTKTVEAKRAIFLTTTTTKSGT